MLRRALLAIAGGATLYAAHPPIGRGWLGLLALAPLAALARELHRDGRPLRSGLGWGTVAGVVFFGPLLLWIINIQELAAWLLLVPIQAVFLGLFVVAVMAWEDRPLRPLVVVVAWVALEALRSIAPLGGFPWGVLGYSQNDGGPLLGIARSLGVLGVSAACAGVGASIEELTHRVRTALRGAPPSSWGPRGFAAAQVPLLAVLGIAVAGVLLSGAPPVPTDRSLDVAGIQGFDVEGSTGRSVPRAIVVAEKMRDVTARAVADPRGVPDLTVWPENAIDGDLRANPELAGIVEEAVALLDGSPLVAGVIAEGPRPRTFVNTMVVFDADGQPVDRYVKRRLVPFGEYVPLRPLLGWIPALARIPADGVAGDEPGILPIAGATVGYGICFDIIFPQLLHEQVRGGAEVIVLGTNNASFGRTAMSDQHIAFSQLRAVESGRWVVHAALSGRSAIIDPTGAVQQRTGQYTQAVIRADIPLVTGLTLATRLGDLVGNLAMAAAFLGLVAVLIDRRRQGRGRRARATDEATGTLIPAGPVI